MNLFKLAELYDRNGDLSKRWYVGYFFKHPETGKYELFQTWISSKLKTKQARRSKALSIIDNINSSLLHGYNPFASENTRLINLKEAINKVIQQKATYTRVRTLSTYKSFVRIFFKFLDKNSLSLLPASCFNFKHAILFSDYLKQNKAVSNRCHNNYIQGLRTIFNEIVLRDYMTDNPFRKVKYLPEEKRNIFAYTHNETAILKEYCINNDPDLWLVCQFIFYCAIRPAELVKLKIKYIDPERGKINVPADISKNKRQSIVSMPEPFRLQLVKLNLKDYDPNYYIFSKQLKPGQEYIYPTRLAERFKKVAVKIGLNRRLYDLKHTGAGLAIIAGANIKDLQLHLRHTDIRTTDEYLKAFISEPSKEFINNFPVL